MRAFTVIPTSIQMRQVLTGAVASFVAATLAFGSNGTPPRYTIQEQRLGAFHAGFRSAEAISKDGLHLAYVAPARLEGKAPPIGLFRGTSQRAYELLREEARFIRWFPVIDGQPGVTYNYINWMGFSEDGRSIAFTAEKDQNWCVVLNGKAGPWYGAIGRLDPVFSPNGRRLAYVVQSREGESVVVDGLRGAECDEVVELTFSPDSKHIAYRAKRNGNEFAVLDENAGPEYDRVSLPVFSYDGKRSTYVATKGNQKQVLVVDGKPGAEYDDVDNVSFSSDGKCVSYLAKKGEKQLLFVDGQIMHGLQVVGTFASGEFKLVHYLAVDGNSVYLVVDGKPSLCAVQKGDKYFAVAAGQLGSAYDNLSLAAVSPDGRRMAFCARKGHMECMIVDGRPGPEFEEVGKFLDCQFSPNGKGFAYLAKSTGKRFAVLNGKAGTPYESSTDGLFHFSSNGRRVAHFAQLKEGGWFVVTDGRPGPRWDFVRDIVFSSDGKRVAYVAEDAGKAFAVVDNMRGRQYDNVGPPVFSADGRHLAYAASDESGRFVVLDDQPGPVYDIVIKKGPTFHQDGVLEYLAVKQETLFRVKHVVVNR